MWEVEIGPNVIYIVAQNGETVLALPANQGAHIARIIDWHNDVYQRARQMERRAARAA